MGTDLGNEDLEVTDDGLVVYATIDRPEKRNAINENVVRGLLEVLQVASDGEARVVVIRGAGEDTFSAGGDFTEMPIGGTAGEYRESFSGLAQVMRALRSADALTVAAVEGDCLAGGFGLAAACDLLVASTAAEFATPEVRVGLFPMQAMVSIMRTVPEKRGLRLLFTGDRIDAEEAADLGLVTAIHPPAAFEDGLADLVESLAAASPVMISMGKEAYYHQRDMDFDAALDYAKEMIALLAMSEDTAEGIEAFMMDREPEWSGR